MSARDVVRSPLVASVALAVLVLATGAPVPEVVLRTVGMLGDMTIPIMQLTLGVSLASLEVRSLGRSAVLSLLKIFGGAAVGAAVAAVLGLGPLARGVLVLQCAMPVAVFNYLFAVRFERQPADVASLIVVSTLLALATTPLVLSWLIGAPG
jgi:predicted permease